VTLRKSTRTWLGVFAASLGAFLLLRRFAAPDCLAGLFLVALVVSAVVLLSRVQAALFRLIVRRLTLRLAFSYFLIGIVPIPLVGALLLLGGYLFANQYVANRIRRELTAVGESAVASRRELPAISVNAEGKVIESGLPWLPPGAQAPWIGLLDRPGILSHGGEVWLVARVREGAEARAIPLTDPRAPYLQELADRTGYALSVEAGQAERRGRDLRIELPGDRAKAGGVPEGRKKRPPEQDAERIERRPRGAAPPGKGVWRGEWLRAFYLETAADAVGERAESGENVAVFSARTSPRVVFEQLFAQGVQEIGRVLWAVFLVVAGTLAVVYLIALGIAFGLVGSIVRNVNRMTRAAQAITRGDFSVRVESKSKDQIGDLARSFDGMAASIERLLRETAEKERLEAEIAIARTIQQKLLPPASASLPGLEILAHFQPVAEIGGDYYDYLRMPDGRTALIVGDVSGHGLPTGLLVAMAKAGLSTLVESGLQGSALFARLNELIHRSTDPRNYMTLVLLAYDAQLREGALTNAGHLAPYRLSEEGLESLSLPSFPLGLFEGREFPTKSFRFRPGDRLIFITDGFVEATDVRQEPFGFERLEALLRPRARAGAEEIRESLLQAVEAHTGAKPLEDDRTLLVATLG
jgi:serine phosphatase RsbU (regulator of sigma subunit)